LLALATAGDFAPRAVRSALRGFIRVRDALAGAAIKNGGPIEWRFE
jgi:hypothetical protein